MKRKSINPTEWNLAFHFDQGELIEGAKRHLNFSGQTPIVQDPDSPIGVGVAHAGDVRAQIKASLARIDAVLEKAGMTRANLTTLRFYTTDVDGFLENYDAYAEWIAETGVRPPQTLLGVDRLALPGLMVEIDATAAD